MLHWAILVQPHSSDPGEKDDCPVPGTVTQDPSVGGLKVTSLPILPDAQQVRANVVELSINIYRNKRDQADNI